MKIFQQNILSSLHDGKYCHFMKYEFIQEEIEHIKQRGQSCVIISGNSDYAHTQEMVEYVDREVPCITKWFAQNLYATHERAEALPLGVTNIIESSRGDKHGVARIDERHTEKLKYMHDDGSTPAHDIYANFNIQTNLAKRRPVMQRCVNVPHIDTNVSTVSLQEYFAQCRNSKMIVCPEGNGIDTHRFWETLYINRVPITLRNKAMNHFSKLPVVWLNDWSELEKLDPILEQYYRVKDKPKVMCGVDFWINKITSEITKIKTNV
jgi:hypothetical protein